MRGSLVSDLEWLVCDNGSLASLYSIFDRYALGFVAKKLCPELVFQPNRHARYSEVSQAYDSEEQCYNKKS